MNDPDFILESASIAQALIIDLQNQNPQHESFDQLGLLDGDKIVCEFIEHGEVGCALDHLLYMIHEADIQFPRERMIVLHKIAERFDEI